ncbi:MAG: DUF998 domain-containing protein [Bacteroidota bacterium]|nr:DUF998 domain-containing protein [Bacteroidota bacterium]
MGTNATVGKERADENRDQVISYFTLRILIGAAGVFLPLLTFIGKLIYEGSAEIEYSISDYYDNGAAGDILVGVLFALGFFLFSYKGPAPIDNRTANIGCVSALGVALFPTTFCSNCWVHYLHFGFALVLFSSFIFFSIFLFRKTSPGKKPTRQKEKRNQVYLICGIIMILCIAGIAVSSFLLDDKLTSKYHLVFWFESIALVSFGFSWITKAEFLFLRDSGSLRPKADK